MNQEEIEKILNSKECIEFAKKYTQQYTNNVAEKIKTTDSKVANLIYGGDTCALFFYDKYNNFVFCFRTKDKTKQDILSSFVRFIEMTINDEKSLFDIKQILKDAAKMEFIQCVQ